LYCRVIETTPLTEHYPFSLHDALPISMRSGFSIERIVAFQVWNSTVFHCASPTRPFAVATASIGASPGSYFVSSERTPGIGDPLDRKSTRLNSSHVKNSYAVFCWKKKR